MKRFDQFIAEQQLVLDLSDQELERMAQELDWEDIMDLYDDDELVQLQDQQDEDEELEEAISASSRLRRSQRLRGRRVSIAQARTMRLRRTSDPSTLQRRSRQAARRAIANRLLRGRSRSALTAPEKDRLEAQLRMMNTLVTTLSAKMLPRMRKIEQTRLQRKRGGSAR